MYKEVRIFLDDSKNIVDVAARAMDNTHGMNLIGGMRIAGEMRQTYRSDVDVGYLVRLKSTVGGVMAWCDKPKAEVVGKNEEEAMRLIIARIEELSNVSSAITRVEDT